uniref:Uncharacterized protein n=1 Tax=Arundo donax TaxID=35708 RepID=A0A0A9D4W4_ARUDO
MTWSLVVHILEQAKESECMKLQLSPPAKEYLQPSP